MIKRIFRSESDLYNLSLKRIELPEQGVNLDYKKVVVNKPWGYEYLLFENKYVAIWVLCLKRNAATSMHCHPNKKTSLIVLSGMITASTLDTEFLLNPLDALIIDSGVFHSSQCVSDDETFLIEIETPPNKNDLVRLKDQYGRENKSYEGSAFMSDKLSEYNYCDFHTQISDKKFEEERSIVGKCMKLFSGDLNNIFNDKIIKEFTHIHNPRICLLEGSIVDDAGNLILGVGEVVDLDFVKKINCDLNTVDCQVLVIY